MLAALAVGAGGSLGALTRYAADRLIEHHPTGFLGAYTTYSTFPQETVKRRGTAAPAWSHVCQHAGQRPRYA
jgi:fluoride ion exporter CrcB/FEX